MGGAVTTRFDSVRRPVLRPPAGPARRGEACFRGLSVGAAAGARAGICGPGLRCAAVGGHGVHGGAICGCAIAGVAIAGSAVGDTAVAARGCVEHGVALLVVGGSGGLAIGKLLPEDVFGFAVD